MTLQQTKRNGAADSIDHQLDVGVGAKLPALYRALQYETRYFTPALCEFGDERRTSLRTQLRFGNQSAECGTGYSSGLQAHDRVRNLLQIANDVSGVGIVQLSLRDLNVEIHTERGFGGPLPVQRRFRNPALERDALHGERRVSIANENLGYGGHNAFARPRFASHHGWTGLGICSHVDTPKHYDT